MGIFIEKMTLDHISEAEEIEKLCFSMPWSQDAFKESLSYEHAIFLVAVEDESRRVEGYIGMYKVFNEGEIINVAVRPERRGQGIGRRLMEEIIRLSAENGIEAVFLEVRFSNERALRLYEKQGFERIGIRKRFYEKPVEDAIVMLRKINPL